MLQYLYMEECVKRIMEEFKWNDPISTATTSGLSSDVVEDL